MKKLKMQQILAAQFKPKDGLYSYSILALEQDGSVWRYDPSCKGWIPYSMDRAECEAHRR